MAEGLIVPFCAEHADYLTDESRCVGAAGTISFPKTGAEVAEVLSKVRGGVTVQGARTGIVAG
ncbi:MAG TPA: FAD-binding oxidoreductase, partial [Armatimonadetes bacterium]|nr:FAD-binding oxidoreductase [Armatimonadota bacterium]